MRRIVGIVAIALATATGCAELGLPDGATGVPGGPAETGNAPAATVPAASVARAKAELARLTVADPRDGGYQRTRDFGPAWSVDVDRNGCGTRDDILRRDLAKVQLRGPAEWLPRAAFRCAYAVQWIGVSTRCKLAVTRPDKSSLTTLLSRC